MTNPITLDPARAERAMRKIKDYQSQIADIEEAIDNLKDVVIGNLPSGETILGNPEKGFVKATVYRARQFNEAYGKKNRPDLWEKAAETMKVVNSTLAKKRLDPEEYAAFQKPSEKMSVKVETIND